MAIDFKKFQNKISKKATKIRSKKLSKRSSKKHVVNKNMTEHMLKKYVQIPK